MRALVLEGGAMRGIFTAGVLDGMAEAGEPPFDVAIGVSAGACCAASFLAGQHRRNYVVYLEYMTGRPFVDPLRVLRGGSLVDMAYLMTPVADRLYPLDLEGLASSGCLLEAVATSVDTAAAAYLPVEGDDALEALHATVAVPLVYRGSPVLYRGERYYDGAMSAPVPVERALELGATELTVILTRPRSFHARPHPPLVRRLLARGLAAWPAIVEAVGRYDKVSNDARRFLEEGLPVPARVYLPPEDFAVSRLTFSKAALHGGYEAGRASYRSGGLTLTGSGPPRPRREQPRRLGAPPAPPERGRALRGPRPAPSPGHD